MQEKKQQLVDAIAAYKKRNNMNYQQLAGHWGVCKTTLYRAAIGEWRKETKKFSVIAEKVGIELTIRRDIDTCEPLISAINDVWDGSTVHAIRLGKVIRQIHELSQHENLK